MLKNKYIEIDFSRDSTNTRLLVPDKNEQIDDIVVGFKTLQENDDFSHSTASSINKITKNKLLFSLSWEIKIRKFMFIW